MELLGNAKEIDPKTVTKTGVMVGLGEDISELLDCFRQMAERKVDILTIGQYLRPSTNQLPMLRYYTPQEFQFLKEEALKMGFRHVESGPLVRSSYHAHEQAESTRTSSCCQLDRPSPKRVGSGATSLRSPALAARRSA